MIALAVVALLFLPLANNAWGVSSAESTPGRAFADFWPNIRRELKIFTIWRMALARSAALVPGRPGAGGDCAACIIAGNRHARIATRSATLDDRVWLLIWIGVPLLVANILLSRSGSVFREDRYLHLYGARLCSGPLPAASWSLGERLARRSAGRLASW